MMQNNSSLEIHNQKEVLFFVSCIIRSGGRGGARFVLRFLGEGEVKWSKAQFYWDIYFKTTSNKHFYYGCPHMNI